MRRRVRPADATLLDRCRSPAEHVLGLIAMSALAGCWVPAEIVVGAEWSDDDEMLAILVQHVDVRRRDRDFVGSDADLERHGEQVFMMPADLSEDARPITSIEDEIPTMCLMSHAGYLLTTNGSNGVVAHSLDGSEAVVFDGEVARSHGFEGPVSILQAIPSPNGAEIAILFEHDDEAHEAIVLVDAPTRTVAHRPFRLTHGRFHRVRWTIDGTLFLMQTVPGKDFSEPNILVWHPDISDFKTQPNPNCQGAETSCGRTSEDGRYVKDGDDLVS